MINKAVILAGGKGSRLGSIVENTPKPMLEVAGKPFIFYLIRQLSAYSIKEIYILTGYKSNVFEKYIKNLNFQNIKINIVKEGKPLGTGGALKNFFKKNLFKERILVMNGDAYIDLNLHETIYKNESNYDIQIIGTNAPPGNHRYGEIVYDINQKRVIGFKEKDNNPQSNIINSGFYIVNNQKLISSYQNDIFSLEDTFFPDQAFKNNIGIKIINNQFFLDIGVPESLDLSQTTIDKPKKCLFLDRDNTINFDSGYTYKKSDLRFTPRIKEIIKYAKTQDFLIIVVTNQSGIGRNYFTKDDLWSFHYHMQSYLIKQDINIDSLYYCPHLPDDTKCQCRKPKAGLVNDIMKDWNIDLQKSIFIGDSKVDKEFACNANIGKFYFINEIEKHKDIKIFFNN